MEKRQVKKTHKGWGKRVLGMLLATSMAIQPCEGFAAAKTVPEDDAPVYKYLQSDRIAKAKLPEGDLIYFGTAAVTLPEEGSYAVKVYREGNLDKKASVQLHTIDMTAVYGEDYELAMEDVEVTGDGKTLLEKYAKGREVISPDEMQELAVSSVTEEEALKKLEESAAEDILDTGIDSTEKSSLARKKEAQTGMKTRKLSQATEEEQGIMDAIMGEIVADAMSSLDSSSQSTITFEKGESEKTVKFNILEDDKSEGVEGFSLLLTDPQDAELYKVTSLAVSIKDDEEAVHPEVSFSQGEYKADGGKAVLKIQRTGAEYSICDMVLRTSGGTAKAGTDYEEKNELIAFAPYEMEKEIEIDVYGGGIFNVFLSELSSCEEGRYTKASVEIAGDGKKGMREAAKSASSTKSFDIKINDQEYSVQYVFGEATGKIMDESYDPPVEAGTYYFAADKAHGGIFEYGSKYMGGDKPSGCRNTDYRYHDESGKDEWEFDTTGKHYGDYGRLEYYSGFTWDDGYAGTTAYNIPGVYYSYFIPDWYTEDSTDKGKRRITIYGTDKATNTRKENTVHTEGHHKRSQDKCPIQNKYDSKLSIYVGAYTDGHCRKSYIRFYGLCAMNRKFNVSVQPPDALKYRSGAAGSVTSDTGLNVEVECGAQPKNADQKSRDIYACQDGSIDNLVFTLSSSNVNGHEGIFAYIDGYKITIDPGKETNKNVTLNYPADLISWLNSKVKKPEKESSISFSQKSVNTQIEKIKSNMSQVPYDAYFLQWINEKQKDVAADGHGYKQNLKFKPVIKYYDVKVEVQEANGGKGKFKDKQLSKKGTYIFHLGDNIDLGGIEVDDPDNYEAVGYQVCTNTENKYNTITDTQELFLGEIPASGVYKIRPVIRRKSNVIEIDMPDNSDASKFDIPGLVSQKELNKLGKEYDSLKGKNILIANPEGKTTLDKIIAVPGKEYIVRVMLNSKADSGTNIYRPRVKQKSSNTEYTTQVFQFTAGPDPVDNIIEVRSSLTKKSSLKKYTIEGNLVSSFKPIRADGQAIKNLPLKGYSVSAGNNEQKKDKKGRDYADVAASTSDTTGKFVLEGITGVSGDIIPLIISDGISNTQTVNVKLSNGIIAPGGGYKVNAENVKFTYPHSAPKVTALKYSYGREDNLAKNGGSSPIAVHIFDDTFTLDATVSTYGRDIQKAIFTVTTDDGKESTYEAYESESNPNHFVTEMQMAESIFPGSKIKVRLVDNEKLYSAAGKDENGKDIIGDDGEVITGIKSQIEYPDVDTGLSFFVEQVLVQPQWYDVDDVDNKIVADVPLIGKATAGTTSGKLTFGKVKWADGNGYTLQVGVNAGIGNQKVPSEEEKLESLQKFMKSISSGKSNAEEIALNKEPGSTKTGKTDLKKEKSEMESVVKQQKSSTSGKAKEAMAAMNKKEPTWKISTSIMLAFDFVKTPENSEYKGETIFTSGGVAIGGTFSFNKTFYTMIASVPAFLNLSSTLQEDLVVAYTTNQGEEALTASAFDAFSGNLAQRLASPQSKLSMMVSGKIQVGVGLCGVLSARGYVSLKLQFDIGLNEDTQSGFLVGSAGGIGFDLLIFSIDLDLYNVTKGWGSLANQTKYSFFGGLMEVEESRRGSTRKASLLNSGNDKIIKKYSKDEVMTEHQYYTGTSDMSGFGMGDGLKRATPGVVKINPLLENAAERTRPRIIPLNDGNTKKMLVFMGNNSPAGKEVAADELNNHALFYSVDNGDGSGWSVPQPVDGDGTLDSTPDIISGKNANGEDKVIIAWADASRAYTETDTTKSKLSAMGISAVVYDVATGQMGEKIQLIHNDEYFNLSPKLNYHDGILYCSYMKRDIASLNDDSELTDLTRSYTTMAYVAYDTVNKEYITHDKDGNKIAVKDISREVTGTAINAIIETGIDAGIPTESSVYGEAASAETDMPDSNYEQYINIYHETLEDPLVMDYQSVITELGSDAYMLSAYTVDEDTNLNTKEDRELFLGIYNITQDREYYPVKITDDDTSQSAPALSDIDGTVYLTWLEDGYMFHMADVSELLKALFDDEGEITIDGGSSDEDITEVKFTINKDLYKDSYIGSSTAGYNWYKRTQEELGITDGEFYKNSLYGALAENTFPSDSASFSQRDDMQTSVSNYTVTSDGKDIYVFFTDFGTKDENSTGVEIYGIRYQNGRNSNTAPAADENSGTEFTVEDSCGFAQAVQITNGNMVIDELSLYMDKNSRISAVSNYFAQYIGADGGMEYSPNKLVEIEFGTKGSMEIKDNYIKLPDTYAAGETGHIEFDVINNGLLTSKGYEYSVYMVKNNTETEIASGTEEAILGSGETQAVLVPWEIPSDLSGTKIKVTVKETGVDGIVVYEAEEDVPYGSNLVFGSTNIMFAQDGSPYIHTTIKNDGNTASAAYKASLCLCDAEGSVTKTYTEIDIPALASGEEKEFEIPFEFGIDDFDYLGISRYSLVVKDGSETVAETTTKYSSSKPLCAQINDGKDITLSNGSTQALEVKTAPWNNASAEVRFYSTDNGVVSVDEKGVITGTGNGSAEVYAYYPVSGLITSASVTVKGSSGGSGSSGGGSSSGGGGGAAATATPVPSQTPAPAQTPEPAQTQVPGQDEVPGGVTGTEEPGQDNAEGTEATKKIKPGKNKVIVKAGGTAKVKFKAVAADNAVRAAAVKVSVSGNKKVTAKIKGQEVIIKAAGKAVKGSKAKVTLKSKNAAGKDASAAINVIIKNSTKKLKAAGSKTFTVKKGSTKKLVLDITAENKNKAATDQIKISSKLATLKKATVKKGKVVLVLKGKKKGKGTLTVKAGNKKAKIKIKVK